MKKWISGGIVFLLVLATMIGIFCPTFNYEKQIVLAEETAEETLANKVYDGLTYVSLGDSIAAGYSLEDWVDNNEYGKQKTNPTPILERSYTNLFSKFLINNYGFKEENCVSFARSGSKTIDLVGYLLDDNVKNAVAQADVITISIGANDLMPLLLDCDYFFSAVQSYLIADYLSTWLGDFLGGLIDVPGLLSNMGFMSKTEAIRRIEQEGIPYAMSVVETGIRNIITLISTGGRLENVTIVNEDSTDKINAMEDANGDGSKWDDFLNGTTIDRTTYDNTNYTPINPTAKVIFTGIFNPFREVELTTDYNIKLSGIVENIDIPIPAKCWQRLGNATEVALGGGQFVVEDNLIGEDETITIEGINPITKRVLNEIIASNSNIADRIFIADTNERFDSYLDDAMNDSSNSKNVKYDPIYARFLDFKGTVQPLADVMATASLDVHPTSVGHALIYGAVRDIFTANFSSFIVDYNGESVDGKNGYSKLISHTNVQLYQDIVLNYDSISCRLSTITFSDDTVKKEGDTSASFYFVINSNYMSQAIARRLNSAVISETVSPIQQLSDDNSLFIDWYLDSGYTQLWSNYNTNTTTGIVHLRAKWSKPTMLGDNIQYTEDYFTCKGSYEFDIDSNNKATWYIQNSSGNITSYENKDTVYFNTSRYDTFSVWCEVNGVKSYETFEIATYCKPTSLSSNEVSIAKTIVPPTKDDTTNEPIPTITNYELEIVHTYANNFDLSLIKWYINDTLATENTLTMEVPNVSTPTTISIKYGGDEIYSVVINPFYTIAFNDNGIDIVTQEVEYGYSAVRPSNPTSETQLFTGWYFNEGYTEECTFTETITSDTTLYARWCQLKYDEDLIKYNTSLDNIESITFNMPASSIMKIVWYENGEALDGETSTKLEYKPKAFGEYMIYCSVDGQYSKAYTFHYYNAPTELQITRGYTGTLNKYSFKLTHNSEHIDDSKIKWYATDDDGNKVELSTGVDDIEYIVTTPIVISVEYCDGETDNVTYLYERILPKYTVQYKISNSVYKTETLELGTLLTDYNVIRENKVLKCWYVDQYTYKNKWDFSTPLTQNMTLYAKYVQLESIDGNVLSQYVQEVTEVAFKIELDGDIEWKVYLEGEEYSTTIGTSTFQFTPERGVVGEYEIYCKYRNAISNTQNLEVIYYAPSALTIAKDSDNCDEQHNEYTMSIVGDEHSFSINSNKLHWHRVDENYLDIIFATGQSIDNEVLDQPYTIYLEYTSGKISVKSNEIKITPTYTVTFISLGEQVGQIQYVQRNGVVTEIPEVSSTGRIFVGWYQDEAYTKTFTSATQIKRNTIVYAKWIQLELVNNTLVNQYVNSVLPTTFCIDVQGTVYWYVNGIYEQTTNVKEGKSIYTLIPEQGLARTYYVRCEYYNQKTDTIQSSNSITINVSYYEPEELLVTKTEQTRNTFIFEIQDENAISINEELFDWYITYTEHDEEKVKVDSDTENVTLSEYRTILSLEANENYVISLNYKGEEVASYTITPSYEITYITEVYEPYVDVVDRYTILTPDRVRRTNYIFAGWYTEYTCENKFDLTTPITQDLILYAKWIQLKYHGGEELLTQYLDSTKRIQFYVELSGVNISWYVNGSRQLLSGSSEVFSYTPSNTCGSYIVTCKINGEESNGITINVYAIPTELKISSSPSRGNKVELSITDSENINGNNCTWVKKNSDGTTEELGTGTTLSATIDTNYEIFVVYRDTNVAEVVSNTLLLEKQTEGTTNSIVWVILAVSVVALGVAGVLVYLKVIKPKRELRVEDKQVEVKSAEPLKTTRTAKTNATTRPKTTEINKTTTPQTTTTAKPSSSTKGKSTTSKPSTTTTKKTTTSNSTGVKTTTKSNTTKPKK